MAVSGTSILQVFEPAAIASDMCVCVYVFVMIDRDLERALWPQIKPQRTLLPSSSSGVRLCTCVLVCERVIGVSFPGPTLFGAARNVIATLKSNRTEGSSGTNYHRERLLPVFYEVRS